MLEIDPKRFDDFVLYYKNMHNVKDIDPSIWMMNYLKKRLELNDNQILWMCFLYAITYHLPSSYMLLNEYPDLELVDEKRIRKWWDNVQKDVPFQRDKLKQRKYLPESILSYQRLVGDSQKEFFDNILIGNAEENFNLIWEELYKNIEHFGRFSVWNWVQALKEVAGYDIKPNKLLLGTSESESHTHGICLAFGKDEWAKKERYTENGKRKKKVHKFALEEIEWLEEQSKLLENVINESGLEVDPFTIETVACAYKKTFRTRDSRYVGYYLDRQAEDIKSIENNFPGVDWDLLWQCREECLKSSYLNETVDKNKFKLSYEEKINEPREAREEAIGALDDW